MSTKQRTPKEHWRM